MPNQKVVELQRSQELSEDADSAEVRQALFTTGRCKTCEVNDAFRGSFTKSCVIPKWPESCQPQ